MKIINNPGYEASNPVEHWTEMEWKRMFDEALKEIDASEEYTESEKEEFRDFMNFRLIIASEIAVRTMEYVRIKAA